MAEETDTQKPSSEAVDPASAGSGIVVAKRTVRDEICCEPVGSYGLPGNYLAGGARPCQNAAKWKVAGSFYCTRHAKQRGGVTFQNA